MIKRMIAGTLSAVICTSSAAVNVSAAGLKALSGYDITGIGKNLFNGCDTLTECGGAELTADTLLIPDSIVSIGENAFAGCSAVKAVKLGSGVETIGRSAFENCTGLESFVVPENVTSMDRCIFRGCTELKELTLPYAATVTRR